LFVTDATTWSAGDVEAVCGAGGSSTTSSMMVDEGSDYPLRKSLGD
jgi:hypothetical protein